MNNSVNSVNFEGAFLLKQPKPRIIKAIKKNAVSGVHKQVFENFTPEGDMLLITRKGKDKDVATFLSHHRTKYEVYTDLSTKSGFDDMLYDEAKEILKSANSKILTTKNELIDFFKLNQIKPPFSKKRKDNPIENSLKALGFSEKNEEVTAKNGYFEVKDKGGHLLARISGPGQYGISFAFVTKKDPITNKLINETDRYALRGGEKIFQYTNESGRAQFLKNYNRAVKANKAIAK